MKTLIAELERAAEGSRELDARIMAITREMPREYSTSLDAALTLSNGLDELCVEMAIYSDEKTVASCCWGPTEPCARQSTEGEAPTPALALCIASLRARQAMKDAAPCT